MTDFKEAPGDKRRGIVLPTIGALPSPDQVENSEGFIRDRLVPIAFGLVKKGFVLSLRYPNPTDAIKLTFQERFRGLHSGTEERELVKQGAKDYRASVGRLLRLLNLRETSPLALSPQQSALAEEFKRLLSAEGYPSNVKPFPELDNISIRTTTFEALIAARQVIAPRPYVIKERPKVPPLNEIPSRRIRTIAHDKKGSLRNQSPKKEPEIQETVAKPLIIIEPEIPEAIIDTVIAPAGNIPEVRQHEKLHDAHFSELEIRMLIGALQNLPDWHKLAPSQQRKLTSLQAAIAAYSLTPDQVGNTTAVLTRKIFDFFQDRDRKILESEQDPNTLSILWTLAGLADDEPFFHSRLRTEIKHHG
jgi:hypothetical protein